MGGRDQLGPLARVEQPGQRRHRERVQAPPLDFQPFLENRIPHPDAFEEFAPIQAFGLAERHRVIRFRQPGKGEGVDLGRRADEFQAICLDHQRRGIHAGQGLADRRYRLAQGVVGLGLGPVAPQQRGQGLPRDRLVRMQRQVGQQRTRLACRQRDRIALPGADVEASQE